MGFIGLVKETNYRLKLRMALQKSSTEELQITKEELHKEFLRRNKKNGKRK